MTTVSIQLPGIRRFHARPQCRARLVCFPHAGGSAIAFSRLSECLPPDIELLAVQYPGRQERRADPSAPDIATLAEECARALLFFGDRPLALFGHSMGSLVAFETAHMITARHSLLRLFASAARPPSQDWAVIDVDSCGEAAIIADLRHLRGVPEELLENEEVRDEILRVLRADYRLLRAYQPSTSGILPVPITEMLGDADPRNSVSAAGAWARHTHAECVVEVLPGGHFYLNDQLPAVASIVARYLRHDLSASAIQPCEEQSP